MSRHCGLFASRTHPGIWWVQKFFHKSQWSIKHNWNSPSVYLSRLGTGTWCAIGAPLAAYDCFDACNFKNLYLRAIILLRPTKSLPVFCYICIIVKGKLVFHAVEFVKELAQSFCFSALSGLSTWLPIGAVMVACELLLKLANFYQLSCLCCSLVKPDKFSTIVMLLRYVTSFISSN